jgi:hypothetical protein
MNLWWKVVPYLPFIVLFAAVLVAVVHVKFYW